MKAAAHVPDPANPVEPPLVQPVAGLKPVGGSDESAHVPVSAGQISCS